MDFLRVSRKNRQMPNGHDPPSDPFGASCLPGLAQHLNESVTSTGTLDAAARLNNQYVVVHLYLVPGDVMQRREMRTAIAAELASLHAIQLHDLAFAIPTSHGSEEMTAEETWNALMLAGARSTGEAAHDGWERGDIAYVHYLGTDGMCVLAAGISRSGMRLPQAIEQ
jgi:hypothetical protein